VNNNEYLKVKTKQLYPLKANFLEKKVELRWCPWYT